MNRAVLLVSLLLQAGTLYALLLIASHLAHDEHRVTCDAWPANVSTMSPQEWATHCRRRAWWLP